MTLSGQEPFYSLTRSTSCGLGGVAEKVILDTGTTFSEDRA